LCARNIGWLSVPSYSPSIALIDIILALAAPSGGGAPIGAS